MGMVQCCCPCGMLGLGPDGSKMCDAYLMVMAKLVCARDSVLELRLGKLLDAL